MKKETVFTQEFAARFKKSYAKKMGGKQTVVMPNAQTFDFDDREYYSGRGAKYNSSTMHDNIGEVVVTSAQVCEAKKADAALKKLVAARLKERKETEKRILAAKNAGVYSLKDSKYSGQYVELSEDESQRNYFDSQRLANTFKISVKDADLLKSKGKTYVFAKSEDGKVYELYHSSLYCNALCIWVSLATPERVAEFKSQEWQSAPYAAHVGQTAHQNHFVC